jgi:RNA-binding protein
MTTTKESASPATPSTKPAPSPKPISSLGGAALRHLRGLGHALAPVVMVGKDGVTDAVVAATRAALLTHELIKVKILGEAPLDRRDAAALLAAGTDSALAQVLGRTLLLYKPHPKKPKIALPGKAARTPGASKARRAKRKARAHATASDRNERVDPRAARH